MKEAAILRPPLEHLCRAFETASFSRPPIEEPLSLHVFKAAPLVVIKPFLAPIVVDFLIKPHDGQPVTGNGTLHTLGKGG